MFFASHYNETFCLLTAVLTWFPCGCEKSGKRILDAPIGVIDDTTGIKTIVRFRRGER